MAAQSWKSHKIRLLNGRDGYIESDAGFQIISEPWNRVCAMPSITYVPDVGRLLMSVSVDYGPKFRPVHYAGITYSDDGGETWCEPFIIDRDPPLNCIGGITYAGGSRVLACSSNKLLISDDCGTTWRVEENSPDGFSAYFAMLSEPDRLINPAQFEFSDPKFLTGEIPQTGFWQSFDRGDTWEGPIAVEHWYSFAEPHMVRAANGDLVCVLRGGERAGAAYCYDRNMNDNYSGMGVSISTDDGSTWSEVNMLYTWGRHHACILLMPDGDLVITYVVRKGYPVNEDGLAQWGIEAVVSHDNGRCWDLDHRFVLATWKATEKGPNYWFKNCQNTSSVVLPDGSIYTVFGTGYRAEQDLSYTQRPNGLPAPRDVGAVHWRKDMTGINGERTISDAHFTSKTRNDIHNGTPPATWAFAADPDRRNIALEESRARVTVSDCMDDPQQILFDPRKEACTRLETIPAFVEIEWPQDHTIDGIAIHPGMPEYARQPITECTPLDYTLKYQKPDGTWELLTAPVINAPRLTEMPEFQARMAYHVQEHMFIYKHDFEPVRTRRIRLEISRTSDQGVRRGAFSRPAIPEGKRKTVIRRIDVFEAR